MSLIRRRFDALIIGAGGGGLRAALQLSKADADVAVVSKVFPTQSVGTMYRNTGTFTRSK